MLMLIVRLIVSIAIPIILSIDPAKTIFPTSTGEKVILAMITFLIWTCLDILRYAKNISEQELKHIDIWNIDNDFEAILNNIRVHYRDISRHFYGKNDLFKDYFIRALTSIAGTIKHAAMKSEIRVKDYHFPNTELVLDAFEGDESQILRYVWCLEHDGPFFDDKWKHYCTQIEETINQNRIKEVRALLVVNPAINIRAEHVLALLGFYEFTEKYSYRLIDNNAYSELVRDHNIDQNYLDFGIYGKRYIYLTLGYTPVTYGDFSKDQSLIDRYTKFFDIVWKSPGARLQSKDDLKKTTLQELFNIDARRFQIH